VDVGRKINWTVQKTEIDSFFNSGPWRAKVNARTASILTDPRDGSYGCAIALLQQVHKPGVVQNAHLIAAAPSMFAYIKRKADEGDAEALRLVMEALGRIS
jgi:hypothetical protein